MNYLIACIVSRKGLEWILLHGHEVDELGLLFITEIAQGKVIGRLIALILNWHGDFYGRVHDLYPLSSLPVFLFSFHLGTQWDEG